MIGIGSTLFHPKRKNFSKVIRESHYTPPGFFKIKYEGQENEILIHSDNFVEVNPDTPQNRLKIQLKYAEA
jgi:hypothetical protein